MAILENIPPFDFKQALISKTKKDKQLARHRAYNEKNREKIAARNKAMRLARLDEIKEKKRIYYTENRQAILDYQTRYRQENREKVLNDKKRWYARNQERLHQYDKERRPRKREQERIRAKNDPQFVIRKRLQSNIAYALALRGIKKTRKTFELVGCTVAELQAHIESKFLPGMSWENRSLWEIDHIRPCASFNLADLEQQKIAFNFRNLQPLWTKDNRSKSAKLDWQPRQYKDEDQLSDSV